MNLLSFRRTLIALAVGALVLVPTTSMARDRGGRHHGHHGGRHHSGWHRGHHGHHGHHWGGRRHYGHSYGYGYYPYARSYWGPSFGLSFSTAPTYTRYVYRGSTVNGSYSDNLAADVQRELKRRGYYRGSIDGAIGPASRSAIRAYQADRGLSVNGRIDRSLLDALDIG